MFTNLFTNMATGKKFIRGANFNEEEEHILLDCVEKFKGIVECKRSDAFTWKEKVRRTTIYIDIFNDWNIIAFVAKVNIG
jgi:hypothetical protein